MSADEELLRDDEKAQQVARANAATGGCSVAFAASESQWQFARRGSSLTLGKKMTQSPDFLSAAGFAFEKRRGVPLGSYELAAIEEAGLSNADCERLADAIWESVQEVKEESYRISAYWALGKHHRPSDRKKFIAALGSEVARSSRAVYQIMIALENYGEEVFDRNRPGRSIEDEALNRADALAFLSRAR